jgi:Tol biopolymer transport system component
MNPARFLPALLAAALLLATGTGCRPGAGAFPTGPFDDTPRPPRLRPDYTDTVVPPNLAPLNFLIEEDATTYAVRVRGDRGLPLELTSREAAVRFPIPAWRTLLATNAGGAIRFEVFARTAAGGWQRFSSVTNRVASEPCEDTLVYRLLKPLYSFYSEVGIYQRDLGSFRQTPVLENRDFGGGCLNCHTPLNRDPGTFALHIRGQPGPQPMLLARSNEVTRVNQTGGYLAWHPDGDLLVFSANKLSLFYHTTGETRDVFDAESSLAVYSLASNVVSRPPPLSRPDRQETWPAWAPDGKHLYFCSAPKLREERFRQVRYDLVRVSFDRARMTWGEPETMVSAEATGLSAAQPRVSPDGRWLLYTLARYGNFPVYQPNSDLHLLDLRTRETRRLEINSDQADTWHCWSGNSRWVVFSSKRGNGVFSRPHFSYVDDAGRFHKPFVLPQADPAFYDACLHTFNLPEFVRGPIRVSPAALARAVVRPDRVLTPGSPAGLSHNEEQNPDPRRE